MKMQKKKKEERKENSNEDIFYNSFHSGGQVIKGSISEHLQKKLDKFFFVLSKTNH